MSDYCTCEFGFRLGDGRTDSNKCPEHDMKPDELYRWGAMGWNEVAALEAERDQLTLRVAELERYIDEHNARILTSLAPDCPIHGVAHSSHECAAQED